jgi:hypothetical protein
MFDPPISVISLNQCDFTSHLDLPVPADPPGELVGSGLVWCQIGDRVDGFGAPLACPAGADRTGLAHDLDCLASLRELDPGRDGDDLEGADLSAAVHGRGGAVGDLDRPPRERGELAAQPGLVALDRQHPVRTAGGEGLDVLALGVQRVRGDNDAGEVDAGQGVQQRTERG